MLTKAEINRLRSLREKKCREAQGVFVVEGAKVTGELLAEGFPLLEIFATGAWEGRAAAARAGVPVRAVTPGEMARISHFPAPPPVLALGRIGRAAPAPGELARGFTLALDGVQDAGNVGTLLRVADWFAFDRVLCSPECADVFSQKVINASMGSFSRVRVITAELAGALAEAAGAGVPVLGCDLEGVSVHALAPLAAAVVVIGGEGRGLSPAVGARVTQRVTIPRHGRAESLNAGVAAAIVCDNLRRAGLAGRGEARGGSPRGQIPCPRG